MDQKKNQERQRSLAAELVAADAQGGGAGGGRVKTATATPYGPESLTRTFNRAARKPHFAPANEQQRRLLADLRSAIQEVTQPAKSNAHERPVSRQAIERMQKELKSPKYKHEMTPRGMVSRTYDREHSRKLIQEINRQTSVLKQNKGKAKEQFNRSSGISH